MFDIQQDSLPSLSPPSQPSQSHSMAPRAEGAPGQELEEQRGARTAVDTQAPEEEPEEVLFGTDMSSVGYTD